MPVRFACPECRTTLQVTRRKIGSRVECPKCLSAITVPAESAPAMSEASVESAGLSAPPVDLIQAAAELMAFDDLPELSALSASEARMSRPLDDEDELDDRASIPRPAIYAQALLLLLTAAVAFGLGYWLGTIDANAVETHAPAASAPASRTAPAAEVSDVPPPEPAENEPSAK